MESWFIWKNKNSREMGLWITTLPGETRAEERVTHVKIPGRSGSLTLLEGDNVYDSYVKECTVTARRDIDYDKILDWLHGEGDVIFSSNRLRAYEARISSQVSFDPISNDLCQAVIPFYCQPLKKQVPTESDITVTAGTMSTLYNPGDVPSKPFVTMSGNRTMLTIGTRSMSFTAETYTNNKNYRVGDMVYYANDLKTYRFNADHSAGGSWESGHVQEVTAIEVDCEAKSIIAVCNTYKYPYTAAYSGEFWEIPVGTAYAGGAGNAGATIVPRWRWR